MVFLSAAAALNYADRVALSTVLPALKKELQLADAQLGLLGSAFLWSYALASPFAGRMADCYSRRRLVLASLLLWSLVTALTGLAGGLLSLLLLRVALGLSESLFLPAAIALTAEHHGAATRGRAISLLPMSIHVGVVVGSVGAGFLADRFGWRTSFGVLGLAGLAFGLIFQPLLTDAAPAVPTKAAGRPGTAEVLGYLIRTPSYCVMLGNAMLAGISNWVLLSWLPLYFQESYNLNLAAAGFMGSAMMQSMNVLGTFSGGWVSDLVAVRYPRGRMLLLGGCYMAAAPALLIFLTAPGMSGALTAVAIFSLILTLGGANEQPALCDVVPSRYRSTAIGLMNTCATSAGGVGVFVAGVMKAAMGLNAIFACLSIAVFIGGSAICASYLFFSPRDLRRAINHDSGNVPVKT